jgi:hypothetical protein
MGIWKTRFEDSAFCERMKFVVSAVQATATLGMFLVAMIGIWKVTPIITYQAAQIEEEKEAAVEAGRLTPEQALADAFANDLLAWWSERVLCYERALELIQQANGTGMNVSCTVVASKAINKPDYLVVKTRDASGVRDEVRAPVNSNALPPSRYIQRKLNAGAFSALSPEMRERVENAIARYMQERMLPELPPVYVNAGMSPEEIYRLISYDQGRREAALEHIRALREVINEAMAG